MRPGIYWNLLSLFLLTVIAFQGMAHMFALLSRGNITIMIIQSITVFLFFVMLSNFMLLYPRLNYVYQLISNLAISRFIFEAVMLLVNGFGRCKPWESQGILLSMGLRDEDYTHCILMLIFNIILYRVISIYLLISKASPVENRRERVSKIDRFRQMLQPVRAFVPGLDGQSSNGLRIKLTRF